MHPSEGQRMFVIDLKPDMVWTGEEGQLIYW